MLSHAFMDNYDGALLVAGDGDYVPLVREVKRLAADIFDPIDADFIQRWRVA